MVKWGLVNYSHFSTWKELYEKRWNQSWWRGPHKIIRCVHNEEGENTLKKVKSVGRVWKREVVGVPRPQLRGTWIYGLILCCILQSVLLEPFCKIFALLLCCGQWNGELYLNFFGRILGHWTTMMGFLCFLCFIERLMNKLCYFWV